MTADVTFVPEMEDGEIREQPRHAERSRDWPRSFVALAECRTR
jgi:hypothetical protein